MRSFKQGPSFVVIGCDCWFEVAVFVGSDGRKRQSACESQKVKIVLGVGSFWIVPRSVALFVHRVGNGIALASQ